MLLVITGRHRSGTSLLQSLCDSHRDIALTNEFGAFFHLNQDLRTHTSGVLRRIWHRRNNPILGRRRMWGKCFYDPIFNEKRIGSSVAGTISKLTQVHFLQNLWFVSRYVARLHVERPRQVDARAGVSALRAAFSCRCIVGDNHPDYLYQLPALTLLTDVKCLVVYRDPRDVVAATLRQIRPRSWLGETVPAHDLRKWWPKDLRTAAALTQLWVEGMETIEQHRAQLHVVRYEDLVTRPADVLTAVGSWLGVDPSGFALEQVVLGGRVAEHREGLSAEELADVVRIAGPTMAKLEYRA